MKTFPLFLLSSALLLAPFHARALFETRDDVTYKDRTDDATVTQRNSERTRTATAQRRCTSSGTMTAAAQEEDSTPLQEEPSSGLETSGVTPAPTKPITTKKTVEFSDSFAAQKTKRPAESLPNTSRTSLLIDTTSDAVFEKCKRQFKKRVTYLETAIDDIREDDSQRGEKIAHLFERAHPAIKPVFEKLLKAASEEDARLAQVAHVYETATPEVKEYLQSVLTSIADDAVSQQNDSREATSEQETSLLLTAKFLELHFILITTQTECDEISEEDPKRPSKIAAAYAVAYPKLKIHLESFLSAIERSPNMYDQKIAEQLATSALELLEATFQSIDRTKMTPIEVPIFHLNSLLDYQEIPQISVTERCIDAQSRAFTNAASDAQATINNLRELLGIFQAPDEDVGKFFLNHLLLKIKRRNSSYSGKTGHIADQLDALHLVIQQDGLSSEREQARKELHAEGRYLVEAMAQNRKECARLENAKKKNEFRMEPAEVRKEALLELMSSAQESITMSAEVVLLASQRTPRSLF